MEVAFSYYSMNLNSVQSFYDVLLPWSPVVMDCLLVNAISGPLSPPVFFFKEKYYLLYSSSSCMELPRLDCHSRKLPFGFRALQSSWFYPPNFWQWNKLPKLRTLNNEHVMCSIRSCIVCESSSSFYFQFHRELFILVSFIYILPSLKLVLDCFSFDALYHFHPSASLNSSSRSGSRVSPVLVLRASACLNFRMSL